MKADAAASRTKPPAHGGLAAGCSQPVGGTDTSSAERLPV